MNIGRILFFVIFVFSLSTVLATGSATEKMFNDAASLYQANIDQLDRELNPNGGLKEAYQQKLLAVFSEFDEEQLSYRELADRLLDLTVPSDYRELHFGLVTSIDSLATGQAASEPVKANLERLKQSYAWLTANLSLFIANNF